MSHSFTSCLIGLPNVGKSSLFNILVNAYQAESENYPFCTIEPNIAIVDYSDPRLYTLQTEYKSLKTVPTRVRFMDIAGLVKDASEGKGLGNAFLASIYETDCIIHVLRCFEDEDILHVEGDVNPLRDLEIIRNELLQKDLQMLSSYKSTKQYKDKKPLLEKIEIGLKNNQLVKIEDSSIHLLSYKPFIILCNGTEDSVHTQAVIEYCNANNFVYIVIDTSALSNNITTTENQMAINAIISACRKALNIISFFTAGPQEIHAWDIYEGTNVRAAGGEIHTDFIKTFIRAQITQNQKMKTVDASYIVQSGDIINIMNNKR